MRPAAKPPQRVPPTAPIWEIKSIINSQDNKILMATMQCSMILIKNSLNTLKNTCILIEMHNIVRLTKATFRIILKGNSTLWNNAQNHDFGKLCSSAEFWFYFDSFCDDVIGVKCRRCSIYKMYQPCNVFSCFVHLYVFLLCTTICLQSSQGRKIGALVPPWITRQSRH